MRILASLSLVLLASCSKLLGIEDPHPGDGMPMPPCTPVINELQTGGTVSPADEWIELYNGCPDAVDVTGWTLVYRGANVTGPTDSTVLVPLKETMAPHAFRLYAGGTYLGARDDIWTNTNLPNGQIGRQDGAVGLRDSNHALVDALAYGAVMPGHPFIETQALGPMSNGMSAARSVDGADTNNNSVDFKILAAPTPGTSNIP